MRTYSREELLQFKPASFLAEGYRERDGSVRPGLTSIYATAVANQLLVAGLAPQELAFTIEAFHAVLPLYDGPAPDRVRDALHEALETVARMIRQPNNEGLVQWLEECASHVRQAEDVAALDAHMVAVLRQYAVLVSFSSEEPSPAVPQ